jgi:3-methyladenine DNA glycosylase/8-oxoguanine DNA glycosylase
MRKALQHLKRADPVLAEIMQRVGPFRMQWREPSFESMVRSIVFQQLAAKAAATIFDRLLATCLGPPAEPVGNGCGIAPEHILALREDQMRACGLSRQKSDYIRDLAARTQAGEIDFARLVEMSESEVIETMTRVKGIGIWSAQMFLIFALQRPDILPTTDYGIRAAMKRSYRKRILPRPEQMEKIAQPWRPYRSVACWYLWRSLDDRPAAGRRNK